MKTSVNLLPSTFRRAALVRRRARQWGALWLLTALVAGAGSCVWYLGRHGAQQARLEAEQRLGERLALAEKRLADDKANLAAIQRQEAVFAGPMAEIPGLLVLGTVSRCARQVQGTLRVEAMSLSRKNPTTGAPAVSGIPAGGNLRLLALTGIATDSLAVASFAAGLRDSGVFTSVQRKLPGADDGGGKRPLSYLIECHF